MAPERPDEAVAVEEIRRFTCPHCQGELAVVYLADTVEAAARAKDELTKAVVAYSHAMGDAVTTLALVDPAKIQ